MWNLRVLVSGCHSDSSGMTADFVAPVGNKLIWVAIEAASYGKWRVQLSCAQLATLSGKHVADGTGFHKTKILPEKFRGLPPLYTKV